MVFDRLRQKLICRRIEMKIKAAVLREFNKPVSLEERRLVGPDQTQRLRKEETYESSSV
jgi:hypothetical protein